MEKTTKKVQGVDAKESNGKIKLDVLTCLVGVITTIMVAGIPWAYTINGRLTSIETKVDALEIPPRWLVEDVKQNTQDIRELRVLINGQ